MIYRLGAQLLYYLGLGWLTIGLISAQQVASTAESRLKAQAYYYQGVLEATRGEQASAFALLGYSYRLWPENPEIAYALGQCYAQRGSYDRTLELFRQAFEADSTRREYFESLVSAYTWGKNQEAAQSLLKQWLKTNPDDEEVIQFLAKSYFSSGEFDKAIALYDSLQREERQYGRYARLAEIKAALYEAAQKVGKAEEELKAVVSAYPEEIEAQVSLINWYHKHELYAKASPLLERLAGGSYPQGELRTLLIAHHLGQGNQDKTLELLKAHLEDLEVSAEDKAMRWYQFLLKMRQGEQIPDQYNSYFARIIELHPDDPSAYLTYGQVLRLQRKFREAIETIAPLRRLAPENPEVWNSLIGDAISLEDTPRVLEFCREALGYIRHDWRYYFYASIGLYSDDKKREAIELLGQGVQEVPESEREGRSHLYAQLGDIYSEEQNWRKAFGYYDEALLANPDNTSVLNNYAYTLAEQDRDLPKAEQMAARGVKLDGDNVNMLDTYAWIFYKQGNYTLAKLYQSKALDRAGDEPSAVLCEHMGDILMAQSEIDEALRYWQQALDLYAQELADSSQTPKDKTRKRHDALRKRFDAAISQKKKP